MDSAGRKKIPVEIIAHRGASSVAPENTLSSVNLAWEMNADGVEIDIRMTSDGKIILLHDNNTKSITGTDLTVSEATSSELRDLDAGILKSAEYAGEKIPFLEEILHNIPSGKKLFIEIKCGAEIFPALEKIIAESGNISQITIIGFNRDTISGAKKYFPEIPVLWVCYALRDVETKSVIAFNYSLIEAALGMGFDGLSLLSAGITPDFADKALSAGLKLYAWTVDDMDEAKRLAALGVHGLVTDRPGWLRDFF